jgi:hypothetical protein
MWDFLSVLRRDTLRSCNENVLFIMKFKFLSFVPSLMQKAREDDKISITKQRMSCWMYLIILTLSHHSVFIFFQIPSRCPSQFSFSFCVTNIFISAYQAFLLLTISILSLYPAHIVSAN